MPSSLIIEADAAPPFMKNGFILSCAASGAAAYIDPGDEAPRLLEWIRARPLRIVSILLTHAHMDHISGVGEVKLHYDVPIHLHPADGFLYDGLQEQSRAFGFDYPPAPPFTDALEEGKPVRVGDLTLDVIHTPGHSPGGVCLVVEDHVFCGDAIFAGSIGRTDLPGGSLRTLLDSIRNKILPLGDGRILHPGHGPDSTIGRERLSNPFLQA